MGRAESQQDGRGTADSARSAEQALPRFCLIRGWEEIIARADHSSAGQSLVFAVERLCRFHGRAFDPRSVLVASHSPMEWPRIFASEMPDAQRQRVEVRALLEANGLVFRELIPLDLRPSALADSIARSVAADRPVLLNSPDAAVVYGYDRREPDHWWWFDRGGAPEIVLESERTVRFTFWSDNAAAGVVWMISGAEDVTPSDPDSLEWSFLRTIVRSVRGVPEEGIAPYPMSLRHIRDLLAQTDSLPSLALPMDTDDPFGILRAKVAREQLLGVLENAESRGKDSAQIEPLRLAQYHMHSAVEALAEMAVALYGNIPGDTALTNLSANWQGVRSRQRALGLITDLLKSEKLALESLQAAVDASGKSSAPQNSPGASRRGR